MPNICEPLARWRDMIDGTYELIDVKQMHDVMDEMVYQFEQGREDG